MSNILVRGVTVWHAGSIYTMEHYVNNGKRWCGWKHAVGGFGLSL